MIKKLSLPNFSDCRYVLLGLLLWVTIAMGCLQVYPTVISEIDLFFRNALLAILIGLTCGSFRKRCHYWTVVFFVLLVAALPWLISWVCSFVKANPLWQLLNLEFFPDERLLAVTKVLQHVAVLSWVAIGALVIASWASLMNRRRGLESSNHSPSPPSEQSWVQRAVNFPFAVVKKLTANRKRFLIGVALVLMGVKLAGDLLQAITNVSPEQIGIAMVDGFLFLVGGLLVLFCIRFALNRNRLWQRGVLGIIGIGILAGVTWWVFWNQSDSFVTWVSGCGYVFLAVLSYFATQKSDVEPVAQGQAENSPHSRLTWFPSVWSLTALSLLIASGWAAFQIDELTWYHTGDWEMATNVQTTRYRSGGALVALRGHLEVRLQEDSPADLFKYLKGKSIRYVSISGVGKAVDFKLLNDLAVCSSNSTVHVFDCELSGQQFAELLKMPMENLQINQLKVQPNDQELDPAAIPMISAFGGPVEFLTDFKSWQNVDTLYLTSPEISPELWRAISRASQTTKVKVVGLEELPDAESLTGVTSAMSISLSGGVPDWGSVDRLLSETKVGELWVFITKNEFEEAYTLSLKHHNRLKIYFEGAPPVLVFEKDAAGQATGLYMPITEWSRKLSEFPHLKTLSFDANWLGVGDPEDYVYDSIEHVDFAAIKELEALYIGGVQIYSGDLLANCKELKVLQISSGDWETTYQASFTPKLESLTIWGVPSKSLAQIVLLPKLKELTVVDVYSELSDPIEENGITTLGPLRLTLKKAQQQAPQLKLKIVDFDDREVKVSPGFEAYRQRLLKKNSSE